MKTIGICYYAIVLKEEKKKQKSTTQKRLQKRIVPNKQSISDKNISIYVIFWNTRNLMGPLSDENKLQFNKRTTKTEKFEKYLKTYIINFKTIRYRLTA